MIFDKIQKKLSVVILSLVALCPIYMEQLSYLSVISISFRFNVLSHIAKLYKHGQVIMLHLIIAVTSYHTRYCAPVIYQFIVVWCYFKQLITHYHQIYMFTTNFSSKFMSQFQFIFRQIFFILNMSLYICYSFCKNFPSIIANAWFVVRYFSSVGQTVLLITLIILS